MFSKYSADIFAVSSERKQIRDVLQVACVEFERNGFSRSAIRQCQQQSPQVFLAEGLAVLSEADDSAGYRFLALLLVNSPQVLPELTDRWKFSRENAAKVAKRLQRVDQNFDSKLAATLPDRNDTRLLEGVDGEAAERALEILDEISPGRRVVPLVRHLTEHPDPKISAKAALLIGKRIQNVSWAKRVITETSEARLRANAIETLWGLTSREVTDLFRECLGDWDNRVVGNAIIGLYRAGDPDTFELVGGLAADANPKLRMTAAWAMGFIGDVNFMSILAPLAKDGQAEVRRAALKSMRGFHIEKQAREQAQLIEREMEPQMEEAVAVAVAVAEPRVEPAVDGPTRQFWS